MLASFQEKIINTTRYLQLSNNFSSSVSIIYIKIQYKQYGDT